MTRERRSAARKKSCDTSIAWTLVRLTSRAEGPCVEPSGSSARNLHAQRGHLDAMHDFGQSRREFRGRRSPGSGDPDRDGEIQRSAGGGRRAARRRGAAPELKRRARQVLWKYAARDRRTLRRDEGVDRRLL